MVLSCATTLCVVNGGGLTFASHASAGEKDLYGLAYLCHWIS